jgi:hypothetical protein
MTNTTRAAATPSKTRTGAKKAATTAAPNPSISSSVANTRAILASFEKFQKERLHFVQTVADHASREHNIEILQQAGVMQLLKPLLGDPVPAIQQAAAVALGRYEHLLRFHLLIRPLIDWPTTIRNWPLLSSMAIFSLSWCIPCRNKMYALSL